MKNSKCRIALALALCLTLTSIPAGYTPIYAGMLPGFTEDNDILKDALALDEANAEDLDVADSGRDIMLPDLDDGNKKEPEYTEGDVIVCIRKQDVAGLSPADAPEGMSNDAAFDDMCSLLEGSEELIEVTEAVKDSGLDGDLNNESFADGPEGYSLPGDDEEYTLNFIHSDIYSTDQLIEMLQDMPGVIFAEPNYVYHIEDELIGEEPIVEDIDVAPVTEGVVVGSVLSDEEPEISTVSEEITQDIMVSGEVSEDSDSSQGKDDYTKYQYAYGNEAGGMDVPYWNTEGYINAGNTIVAVLDSGVDYEHEDLKDVMWDEGLMYPELLALGGGRYGFNGCDENSNGTPYLSSDPMDDNGHGTHCAGSVGAPWNGYGVSGTANGTRIMALKGGTDKGSFPNKATLKSFNYIKAAKEAGVNVVAVNNSWGGAVNSAGTMLSAKELGRLGVICCFASGNDNNDNDYIYDTTTVLREIEEDINVNANDEAGVKCDFSNYGIRTTDLSSPGESIMSTYPRGMGAPDPFKSTPVTDTNGKNARDLFDDSTEDSHFTYVSLNRASYEYKDDEGEKVLAITGLHQKKEVISIKCGRFDKKPGYLALSDKFGIPSGLATVVMVLKNDGTFEDIYPHTYTDTKYTSNNRYALPEDMNLEEPEIRLKVWLYKQPGDTPYCINGISFTDQCLDYAYNSGTSMATPAVTGEVAVVASRWPGEDASKRAARIIGSAKYSAPLADTCRTDGIANVRGALTCDYIPVVSRAWMDDKGLINISGYFFGDDKGSVKVYSGGTPVTGLQIKTWSGLDSSLWNEDGRNDKDTIILDPGTFEYTGGELSIKVTSGAGKTGSRMLVLNPAAVSNPAFCEELPIPQEKDGRLYTDFMESVFMYGTALNGALYYGGACPDEDGEYEYAMWKYTLSGNATGSSWEKISDKVTVSGYSNLCAWNKMLVYLKAGTMDIGLYSPDEDMFYDPGISIPGIEKMSISSAYFVNAGGDLYMLLNKDENGKTGLYRIDFKDKKAYRLYELRSAQDAPVLRADKDSAGTVTIYSLAKKDPEDNGSPIVSEKITVKADVVSSETTEIPLFDGYSFYDGYLNGAANQYGIILTGPASKTKDTDMFMYSYADGTIVSSNKLIVPGRPGSVIATEYKGKTYFLCFGMYEGNGRKFGYSDDDDLRGSSAVREPLHYYGDDKVSDIGKFTKVTRLTASDDGRVAVGRKIRVTPEPVKDGDSTVEVSYTFYSEDAGIAAVDQKGVVTGKLNGKTTIHAVGRDAQGNEYEGSCGVLVYSKITGIKLNASRLSVAAGSSFELSAKVTPDDADNTQIEWSVSVPSSYPGSVIKAGGKNGSAVFHTKDVGAVMKATITARTTDGSNKKATCVVTVGRPVTGISLKSGNRVLEDNETITVNEGKAVSLKAVISPSDALNKSVKWDSSDTDVATVDKNGRVKAVGKGTSVITAVAADGSGTEKSCIINVVAPVRSAALSDTGTIMLGTGMEHEVRLVRIQPYNPSDYTVKWSSTSPAVSVSVNAADTNKAVIKSTGKGTAKITAVITNKAAGGKATVKTNTLTVKVLQSDVSANGIKIFNKKKDITGTSVSENRLPVGKKLTLKSVSYQNGKAVKAGKTKAIWTSSDPETATVNNGTITAYKEGAVTITATLVPTGTFRSGKDREISASFELYVYNPVKKIKLEDYDKPGKKVKKLTKMAGAYFGICAYGETALTKAGDTSREVKDYKWTSSNTNVVKVVGSWPGEPGMAGLEAVSAGKAVITVKATDGSNKTAKMTVTVYEKVKDIKLSALKLGDARVSGYNEKEITVSGLALKKSFTISPNISPGTASNKAVVYRSTNTAAVTVNNKGVVKRCGEGAADIYVTTVDGGYTAVCHVLK